MPLFLLILSYNLVAYNLNFYKNEFSKHDVYTNLEKEDVDREAANVINYLKTGEINKNYFNEKELNHLKDVYNLNNIVCYLFYILLAIISVCLLTLLYSKSYKEIYSSIFISGLTSIAFAIVLSILITISFTTSFTLFHEILFTNDLWQLNPATDKIILMFPEGFFLDAFIRIIVYIITFSLVLTFAGELLLKHKIYKRIKPA